VKLTDLQLTELARNPSFELRTSEVRISDASLAVDDSPKRVVWDALDFDGFNGWRLSVMGRTLTLSHNCSQHDPHRDSIREQAQAS
jgi:hypothetical protein